MNFQGQYACEVLTCNYPGSIHQQQQQQQNYEGTESAILIL